MNTATLEAEVLWLVRYGSMKGNIPFTAMSIVNVLAQSPFSVGEIPAAVHAIFPVLSNEIVTHIQQVDVNPELQDATWGAIHAALKHEKAMRVELRDRAFMERSLVHSKVLLPKAGGADVSNLIGQMASAHITPRAPVRSREQLLVAYFQRLADEINVDAADPVAELRRVKRLAEGVADIANKRARRE